MRKRWTLLSTNETEIQGLQEALKIHPMLCRLLVQRGIKTFEQAKQFFRPQLSDLHDPFLMKDMDKAVARLEKAIQNKERILLYGDYDVDGTTSIALFYSFLEKHHEHLDYYIPDRYKEGYGVSLAGVDYAQQNGVDLVIAMDCGINAIEQVRLAKELGIDFIICDHHLPKVTLPDAVAILDPKQFDCKYPYKELSGCGVAFKLAQAYIEKNGLDWGEIEQLLDFLVISIASDIVPITGENRTLAFFGLKKLNQTVRPGLKALIHESRRTSPLIISDIVFGLGPLINAAGRLADAQQAVRLMLSKDKFVAFENAHILKNRNELRKEYDQLISEEAKKLFRGMPDWKVRKSIVLYQPHWHKGIVGIAASRLVETFHRPTIILTESNGKAVGSARSVGGFNVHNAIKNCEDLLLNFGGHAHAAGLTLEQKNVSLLQEKFEKVVRDSIEKESLIPEEKISTVLNFADITPKFWRILKQFAPFGPGNRSPIFVTKNVEDIGYSKLLRGNHLKLALKQGDSKPIYGIAFGRGDDFEKIARKNPFHICYKLEENEWQGRKTLQLIVKDLKF